MATKAGGASFDATLSGNKALSQFLKEFPAKIQRKVMKSAVNLGLAPIRKEARARVPRRFGFLKKAIKSKTKLYKWSGTIWAAVGIAREIKVEREGKLIWPIKYAHLAEFGTKYAKAQPFMSTAFSSQKKAAMNRITTEVKKKLDKEAVKFAKTLGKK